MERAGATFQGDVFAVQDDVIISTAQTLSISAYQAPANLCIFLNNKEPLVTIKPDGSIEYGPNYTPDATAKAMWEAMGFRRALYEAAPEMLAALKAITDLYCRLAASGDCGNWNPDEDAEVIQAKAAISKATGNPA